MEDSINSKNDSKNSFTDENYIEEKNQNLIQESNYNNNELEQKEESEEEPDPSKEIELLFNSLLEMYSKKQFKKILKAMVLKADKGNKFNLFEWKLLFLRTQTIQRILEKKNSMYYKFSKAPHFSEYIQKLNNDIDHWISFTQELMNI